MRNLPPIVQNKVYDTLFEKYGIEEEDLLVNLKTNGNALVS
jgi:hypothetical protein